MTWQLKRRQCCNTFMSLNILDFQTIPTKTSSIFEVAQTNYSIYFALSEYAIVMQLGQ